MCGIIGYSGICSAMPKIIGGLSALEYRGYDSAGVAFFENNILKTVKTKGRVEKLKEALGEICLSGEIHCGIGHTRWATHGEPSDTNAHPHGTDRVRIVHNGIIENYDDIKEFLSSKGYVFESETDTEAAAKLMDFFYGETSSPVETIKKTREVLRGSYAVCVLFYDCKDFIFGFRRDNPLIVAKSEKGNFFASDISAVLMYTNQVRRIEENEIVALNRETITIQNETGEVDSIDFEYIEWNAEEAEKGEFPHFMLKEIHEAPEMIERTIKALVKDGVPDFGFKFPKEIRRIHIVACGTAMHAGLAGKYLLENKLGIGVSVEIASEFRYRNPVLDKNDLVVVISQSGETADTLAALRLAKKKGVTVLGIVNVRGSSVAREADLVIYTQAGIEVAVASTKAYSVQLAVMYLMSFGLGFSLDEIDCDRTRKMVATLQSKVPYAIKKALEKKEKCMVIAQKYKNSKSIFFMGRGIDYTIACEAALKMKEISYIHCEGIAAGEMKHGTISLISDGTPVFVFATDKKLFEKTMSNIKEVAARGARVVLFCNEGSEIPEGIAEDIVKVPECEDFFEPIVAATLAQLTAYYVAVELGLDVDKPRNLAKSVTVE